MDSIPRRFEDRWQSDLFLVHRLLCPIEDNPKLKDFIGIALDIAVRYFKQSEQIGRGVEEGSTLTDSIITRA
jgi:hypothetical protein